MAKKRKTWNEQYTKYIKSEITRIWGWSPARKQSRLRALVQRVPIELFRCELCDKKPLARNEVECDHKVPKESTSGWDGWDNYIYRSLDHGGQDGLQWLCKECHKNKTVKENALRRKNKSKSKKEDK